ncbi:MAG: SH3 domain-containing protein [bacterium]|nr:SH3 domain-containing protein [bacterium]
MADVKSLKCPNCGGNVHGEGEVKCEYCGSMLSISKQTDARAAQPQYIVTFSQSERTYAFFNDLPGKLISITTTDIPFEPNVIYTNLPGGQLDPNLESDADEILALFKTVQDALNAEDLDGYLSTFSPAKPEYIAEVKEIVQQQFAYSDLKRYTVTVDFTALSPDRAEVVVTNESLTFPVAGPFERLDVQFSYQLEKYRGSWKIAGSTLVKKAAKESKLGKTIYKLIIALIIVIVLSVLVTVCLSVGGSFCGVFGSIAPALFGVEDGEDISFKELTSSPENDEAIGRTVQVDDDRLTLFAEPTTSSERLDYVSSGILVVVVESREDYWLHVQLDGGDEGWTPAKVRGDYIDGLSGDSTCSSYDPTGSQNGAWVGRSVTVGPERVKLYSQPSEGSDRIARLTEGKKLEVLEAGDDFWIRMKTEKGEIGWGRCSFVGNHVNGKSD